MKPFLIIIFIFLTISCSSTKDTVSNSGELNGSWVPVKQEIGGQELAEADFQNQKLAIVDTSFLFIAEGADEGTIKYINGKMDIYIDTGVNAGKHFTAIYELNGGLLTICYDLTGEIYPEAFETKSNSNFFLSVFAKE
jgi:uncharacterized protein (TIGR03067 family)